MMTLNGKIGSAYNAGIDGLKIIGLFIGRKVKKNDLLDYD
jgi:hypothetical protein